MKIGFLGTGAIAEAMVIGLCSAGNYTDLILLSPRNKDRVASLVTRFENVEAADSNQRLVDDCDLLFVAVLPDQFRTCVSELRFRDDMQIVSLVAGFSIEEIRELAAPVTNVARIIPLPPVEHGLGAIPVYPQDEQLQQLLSRVGDVVPVGDEIEFLAFTSASSMMATFFEVVSSVATWMQERGVASESASIYSTSMFKALAQLAARGGPRRLHELADECLTTGGLNEQVLQGLREAGWFKQVDHSLDRIATRLEKWAEEMHDAR